ncbi:MAG: hypothetical protein F4152_08425 [Dehalococcoidia bacterium]|nr:hypothetical protein [Acidobacteriota bacterium]MYH68547.1 hypothetical protein [Dehalococcoidia bacterium]
MTAISDYFRTAILIDDRVEPDYRPLEELDSRRAGPPNGEPESGLVAPPEEDETPVRPSSLVSAFLKENVVCSVVEPSAESADIVEMAQRGARIADLLILDWLLFGSDSATVDAIREITEQSQSRLRVVVVFTGANSLSDVVARLVEDAGFREFHEFVLRRGNTVVLVFGKPGPLLTGGEDRRQPSTYGDLPRMIRDDLEMVFKGLMPEFAFRGINTLRESTPRILATFNSDLDAAALVHRALLPEPADAGPQFVRLLASDFEQAMHDGRVGEVWDQESVRTHVEDTPLVSSPDQLAGRLKSNQSVRDNLKALDASELVQEAIVHGLSKIGMADNAVSKVVADLAAAVGDASAPDESLAVLMSSSNLGDKPPRLELGVVLRDGEGGYWLCVQPLCHSVRLASSRAFPMVPLSLDPKEPAAMIRSPEGDAIRVGVDPRPYRLAVPRFSPTKEGAVFAEGSPSNWHFTSDGDIQYRAITRLRPEVSARAVHGLVSAASQVGVDISEWLRRGAP